MDWAISGVNTSSNSGGPACRQYMPDSWRILESVYIVAFAFALTWWAYSRITLPTLQCRLANYDAIKVALLVFFSITFGVEIGFKLASKTVIYLLNPCHVMTVMQLYLLAAAPSNKVTTVFRIHLNLLNGPILAFLFPETDNRRLPFEKWVYWVQHSLLVIVPFYLLRQGGAYNVEPLRDITWVSFSYGLNLIYHFLILQPLAFPISVNLNHMLCPAESDPFAGPLYRTFAAIHQGLLCPLACKLVCMWLADDINGPETPTALVKTSPKDKKRP